jgi:hypothetical protein
VASLQVVSHWFDSSIAHFSLKPMKKKTFNKLIQGPLRFHHQDIHEELEDIKGMLKNVISQMQELREGVRGSPNEN